MGKPLRYALLGVFAAALLFAAGAREGFADPSLEETKALLQKGLTLAELDHEIERLTGEEVKIGEDIARTEEQITANQTNVAKTREHAAKVLRAYYMGDRENIWLMVFSAKSISEALSIYEYMSTILQNDHHALGAYSDSYQALVDSKTKLESTRKELEDVKAQFIAQRDRAAEVQKQIDEAIAASSDAAALKTQLDQFVDEWKEKGVPLFRSYLNAMSMAAQSLPELLMGENAQKYVQFDTFKGAATFNIPDADLTAFFQSKQPLLNNITLKADKGQFMAFGTDNGTRISLKGHYTVENNPNELKFHVDELLYNDFVLPDTSNRSLEQEFDLGFNPDKLGIKILDITLEGGKLSLKLKF